jgi:hypothetical protein
LEIENIGNVNDGMKPFKDASNVNGKEMIELVKNIYEITLWR